MGKYRIIETAQLRFEVEKLEWTFKAPILPWMAPCPVQEWVMMAHYPDKKSAEQYLNFYIEAMNFKPVVHMEVEA